MKLSKLLKPLGTCKSLGPINKKIVGIYDNSRNVVSGGLFVAVKGLTVDGYDFIDEAIKKGAVVVVGENIPKKEWLKKITYVKVKDSRKALGQLAASWYGDPSKKLKVIGVTGTDGKTTTTSMIYHILKSSGKKVGLVTTVSARIGNTEYFTGFHVTNPGALELEKFLSQMVKKGCEYAVLEVTSHGIDQKRVAGIDFDIGILTNITHEHLDYHKTFSSYKKTKLGFLRKARKSFKGGRIDPLAKKIKEKYNQENMSLAISVTRYIGIKESEIEKAISTFPGVIGRLEEIKNRKGLNIFIDFAHTPNALEKVLGELRKRTKNKLICVFGCAGERDIDKRAMMGKISANLADISIFTAEDPRSEDVNEIIDAMEKGAKKSDEIRSQKHVYLRVPERGEAIAYAIQKIAQKGDTVVICGKGHEKSMAYEGIEYPWSDREAVEVALKGKVKEIHRQKKHIHFMGIGGSGMSGVALFTKQNGFIVSGCDLEKKTAYSDQLKKAGIPTKVGHNKSHLQGVDMLVTTPAVLFQNSDHSEVVNASNKLTWQEFLGKRLLGGKRVIAISGTHGKSTTAAMLAKVFVASGMDPSVMVGAIVSEWKKSYRLGKSNVFIVEADEFYDNFLNYKPETAIVNNIEFDHPDYFRSEAQLIASFIEFIKNLAGNKNLIVNQDSPGVKKLVESIDRNLISDINIYGFTLNNKPLYKTRNSLKVNPLKTDKDQTVFSARSDSLQIDEKFRLKIPGLHNVYNAAGVILTSKIYGIKEDNIKNSLWNFSGIGRRLELIGEHKGIFIYDDYAHHPTAVRETIGALRQRHPKNRIWAVVEPHSYSRTKALLSNYKGVFDEADKVIVGPIFKARDISKYGVSGESIVKVSNHGQIENIDKEDGIIDRLRKELKSGDVVLVMGAGKSYLWARRILKNI